MPHSSSVLPQGLFVKGLDEMVRKCAGVLERSVSSTDTADVDTAAAECVMDLEALLESSCGSETARRLRLREWATERGLEQAAPSSDGLAGDGVDRPRWHGTRRGDRLCRKYEALVAAARFFDFSDLDHPLPVPEVPDMTVEAEAEAVAEVGEEAGGTLGLWWQEDAESEVTGA